MALTGEPEGANKDREQRRPDEARVVAESSDAIETNFSCVVVRVSGDGPIMVDAPAGSTLVTVPDFDEGAGDLWVNTADQWGPFAVTTAVGLRAR